MCQISISQSWRILKQREKIQKIYSFTSFNIGVSFVLQILAII
jgi:pterin-4a-carbinolamine dehydratase